MDSRPVASEQHRLEDLYTAFNRRDIPTMLAAMTPDVWWPNAWEGGVVHGHDELSHYWLRQWEQIVPVVTPTSFSVEADGRIAVTAHQVVRDKAGTTVADQTVTHLYRFVDGLVAMMEIRE